MTEASVQKAFLSSENLSDFANDVQPVKSRKTTNPIIYFQTCPPGNNLCTKVNVSCKKMNVHKKHRVLQLV